MSTVPLILVTNDDGVRSPGLLAAVQALHGLGEIVVSAPREQQSSAGRAFYWKSGRARRYTMQVHGSPIRAYGVDASPAVSVRYALAILADRIPSLVVSGINYGENLGSGLTISGTVGAAIEGAAWGVPALAASLETDPEFHTSHSRTINFESAGFFVRRFAEYMLQEGEPAAPLLNLNVPKRATTETAWRITRASRQAYFRSLVKRRRFTGYDVSVDLERLEPDSDIQALYVEHLVSVTPLTFDLTAQVDRRELEKRLRGKLR